VSAGTEQETGIFLDALAGLVGHSGQAPPDAIGKIEG
jgi:hypothetical protein